MMRWIARWVIRHYATELLQLQDFAQSRLMHITRGFVAQAESTGVQGQHKRDFVVAGVTSFYRAHHWEVPPLKTLHLAIEWALNFGR